MSADDIEYFRERAAVERGLAKAATEPRVIAVHEALARGYEVLAGREEMGGGSGLVTSDHQDSASL